MAISSPRLPLPSVSPLSTFFSQERRRRGGFQLRASLDSMFPSNHDPEIKRQNHIREKLSNTKFSVDSGANQPIEADVEVPIDERSKKHSVISREIDGFGFSEGGIEKEGAKQAALRMRNEEKSNSQILVSQEVESSQIQSEIGESSRTIGMVSEEMHQLEGFVREEEGTDPFRAPTFGLAVRIGALLLAQTFSLFCFLV